MAGDEDSHRDKEMAGYIFLRRRAEIHTTSSSGGNSFRQAVWKILLQIPYGQTVTYGEIAQQLAAEQGISTMSAQAVGGAVGHNKISIIIPCHRVIGADGSLTGYAGGIDKKIALLGLEGTDKYESLCSTNIG